MIDSDQGGSKVGKIRVGIGIVVIMVLFIAIYISIWQGNFTIMFFGILAAAMLWISEKLVRSKISNKKEGNYVFLILSLVVGVSVLMSIWKENFIMMFLGILAAAIVRIAMNVDLDKIGPSKKKVLYQKDNNILKSKDDGGNCESLKSLDDIEKEVQKLKDMEKMIDTRGVRSALNGGKIEDAKRLLKKLKENYKEYEKTIQELKELDKKKSQLARQLAEEKIDRDTYKDAVKNIEHTKADLEEKLNKLREEVIHEDYEKPF